MELAVIGSGYVGLVAGVGFADAGHTVYCVDKDESKIASLQAGKIPIYEPGLEDLMARSRSRLMFTTNLNEAVDHSEVLFIAVGTPEKADGSADLGPVFEVVRSICAVATQPRIIVLKSTVPVGTARQVQNIIREYAKAPIEVVNNPEFLREGAAVDDFMSPDRVVIGTQSSRARQAMEDLYRPFTLQQGRPLIFMDNTSAEMTKYAANAFLSLKISFINEIALLADKVGADVNSVKTGFTSDHRINPAFFNPGIGFGGSCFPKDVKALIHTGQQYGVPMELVAAADNVNDRQKTILFERMKEHFGGSVKGLRVALWGLAFKPSTDDIREAPALYLIEELHKAGAVVSAYDPVAGPNARRACKAHFELADSAMACVDGADTLVIATEWNEFKNPDFQLLKSRLKTLSIFDGRNIFDPKQIRDLGFSYFCIGRQSIHEG